MAPKSLSNLNPSKKKEEIQRSSSSEEESEENVSEDEVAEAQENSDSEVESDESPSAYKMQPVPEPPASKTKRAHVEDINGQASPKSAKKMKPEEKKAGVVGGSNKLWSDDDEVALLKGLLENVKSGNEEIGGGFYDTMKGKLQVQISKDQFRGKINGLKKKYLNAIKRQPDGSDPVYSKPHEVMIFELSKKIWGRSSGADGKEKSIKNDDGEGVHEKSKKDAVNGEKNWISGKKNVTCEEEDEGEEGITWSKYRFLRSSFDDLAGRYPSIAMSGAVKSLVEEKLRLAGRKVAKDLNDKWKQLITEETELHYKMISLMKEQIELALNQ